MFIYGNNLRWTFFGHKKREKLVIKMIISCRTEWVVSLSKYGHVRGLPLLSWPLALEVHSDQEWHFLRVVAMKIPTVNVKHPEFQSMTEALSRPCHVPSFLRYVCSTCTLRQTVRRLVINLFLNPSARCSSTSCLTGSNMWNWQIMIIRIYPQCH